MTTVKIQGMSCQHCVAAVTKALQGISGIRNLRVALDTGEATFDADPSVDMAVIRQAVTKAGYTVE